MLADGSNCPCLLPAAHGDVRPLAFPERPPVPIETEPVPPDSSEPLDERELAVVAALRAEEHTAFQGLRRKLGLHQQALTRTLRRLERQGVVERDERGYALTAQGRSAVKGLVPLAASREPGELLPVLQALLPPAITADDVADRLARRWFRDLRWYGRSDATPGEVALSWLTVDTGALVRVRFAQGMAVLEVELAPGERLDRFPAAQAVLKALAELYASGVPQQAA